MRRSSLYQRQHSGFTLIEMLAVGVLTIFVGIFGFTAYYVMTNAEIYNENQIKAINLTQQVMEAVEAQSNLNFDTLSTTTITSTLAANVNGSITNNVLMTSGPFAGMTVDAVEVPTKNAQLKQIDVSVSGGAQGQAVNIYTSFMVTRPAANLPGDIAGMVTDANSGVPVVGAQVEVCFLNDPTNLNDPSNKSLCDTTTTNAQGNYSFQDKATLAYILQIGEWILTATQSNYEPYTDAMPLEVFSGEQTSYNFSMLPNPQPATINVDVQDNNPADVKNNSNKAIDISTFVALYQKGSPATNIAFSVNNSKVSTNPYSFTSPASFTIPYNIKNAGLTECFTVVTGWSGTWYPYGYATSTSTNPPDATIGKLPPALSGASPGYPAPPAGYQTTPPLVPQYDLGYSEFDYENNYGNYVACPLYTYNSTTTTSYDYRGWSSAIYAPQGNNCTTEQSGYFGSAKADNVCVTAGQNQNVIAQLVQNPTAILKGQISYMADNGTITPETHGGSVTAYWGPLTPGFDAQGPDGIAYTTLDPNGNYQLTIPAAQELFPDSEGYWIGIQVCGMAYNETYTPYRWEMLCSPSYNVTVSPWTQYGNPTGQDMSVWTTSTSRNTSYVDGILTPPANAHGVYEGDVITKNVAIVNVGPVAPGPPPPACLFISGKVVDASTGSPLVGATVSLPGYAKIYTTDANGNYNDCVSAFDETNNASSCVGSNCPIGLWTVKDTNGSGYYPYVSSQTAWYVPKTTCTSTGTSPLLNMGYTFPTIYLLPAHTGIIKVIVQHPGTYNGEYPFGNLQVTLTQVDGTTLVGRSNAITGEVDFPNALTTPPNASVYDAWPDASFPAEVSSLVPSGTFNSKALSISISVAAPNSNYYAASQAGIALTATNTPLTVYITVEKKPGA